MKNVGLLPSGEVDGEKNEIIVYQPEGGEFHIEVRVDQDTVWLTQDQMSELFDTSRSSIAYHIGNIFKEKELPKETSVEIFDRSNKASRPPQYYNLDLPLTDVVEHEVSIRQ